MGGSRDYIGINSRNAHIENPQTGQTSVRKTLLNKLYGSFLQGLPYLGADGILTHFLRRGEQSSP